VQPIKVFNIADRQQIHPMFPTVTHMPRNIEIKALVHDFQPLLDTLGRMATESPVELWQEDTFFRCRTGRLKVRRFSPDSGELIGYTRSDVAAPKESHYQRLPTTQPDLLRDVLGSALGTLGVVRKHRVVYMVGRTRVHLDDVADLGKFVELEVVLADAESASTGTREALELMSTLGIRAEQLVAGAYIDRLEQGMTEELNSEL
jgi:predicted adenylyl cyclase CyaB